MLDCAAADVGRVAPRGRRTGWWECDLANDTLTDHFLDEAERAGLAHLRGHPHVGGLRASLYNAMPEAGVDALIRFMKQFARRYG